MLDMNKVNTKELRKKFKEMYLEEFHDSNESFMDFMLDLISKRMLAKIIAKGNKYYYSIFKRYK